MHRLQELQERLPGRRGHRHLQGRVHGPPLRRPAAAARGLLDGPDPLVGPPGAASRRGWRTPSARRPGSPGWPSSWPASTRTGAAALRRRGRSAPICPPDVPDLGGARSTPSAGVVLFADTFTDGFAPSQGLAALRVLRAAGFSVEVPRADLCCGRPLYDRGFLQQARRLLGQILDAFEPELDSGVPVVVLEPSCEAVFHDELPNLFPADPRAKRLDGLVIGLGEFVSATPQPTFGPALRGPTRRRRPSSTATATRRRSSGWPDEEAVAAVDRPGAGPARARLLRHGRRLRLRARRALRALDEDRRAGPPAGRPRGRAG